MKSHPLLLLILLTAATLSTKASNNISEPFVTSNLAPFVQLHNLPAARPAAVKRKGTLQIRMTSEVANNFTSNNTNAESITIDGETWRNQLQVSYSLTDKWELSIAIPHVAHDGGSFDGFIEDWHKVFGLPNKARRAVAQNKLNYQ